ncbi:hypothetical protein HK099_001833 [Clydaea vesicula]|uniref:Nicotinate-nucleotide pyrophosphorylase [carboxylating] n=1 Tax=Clydaea vesicula TaxID=447962 RepID=A0AAD5XUV2_9FUNG|nr:hypothetical protein HK099_001833 [Clydaea vesicula]KAJ3386832.1 hypothetical protein HDU92_002238 [Lobulomyces angularis]
MTDTNSTYVNLLPHNWKDVVSSWLNEDAPSFDYGGYVVGTTFETAKLYIKASGVVAGIPFFDQVFRLLGCKVEWLIMEGDKITLNTGEQKRCIAYVTGNTNSILLGERPALNMIARASGIATKSRHLLELKEKHNWHGIIAGTRKTTPGFRIVEKYAMLVGGVDTHRMDLSTMIMLKDNHIKAAGDIQKAVNKARSVGGFSLKIEVETSSYEEAKTAILAGADIIMLDNFTCDEIKVVSKKLKDDFKDKKFFLEGSGGLTEHNCVDYFCEGLDILSFGSLSQSVGHIDFSLKL